MLKRHGPCMTDLGWCRRQTVSRRKQSSEAVGEQSAGSRRRSRRPAVGWQSVAVGEQTVADGWVACFLMRAGSCGRRLGCSRRGRMAVVCGAASASASARLQIATMLESALVCTRMCGVCARLHGVCGSTHDDVICHFLAGAPRRRAPAPVSACGMIW